MNPLRQHPVYKTALAIVLVYMIWMMLPAAHNYFRLVAGGARRAPARVPVSQQKMSAADLETALRNANGLGPDAQLRCTASREWDYVCSYLPTALPSPRRLQFGVNVDAKRWVKISPVVPVGNALPGPQ